MVDLAEKFAAARFSLRAVIYTAAGQKEVTDIVSVAATFALNTIPTASVVFATGQNTLSNNKASIHTIRNLIEARDKIEIFLTITGSDSGDNRKINPGVYKIFDGFIVGFGYQRAHNHANFVVNVVHWLDDLNNSTAVKIGRAHV